MSVNATIKSINDSIGNVSGAVSASAGIVTYVDSVDGFSLMRYLNENAPAIGVIFTGLTFFVFLASKAISNIIEIIEARARLRKLDKLPDDTE